MTIPVANQAAALAFVAPPALLASAASADADKGPLELTISPELNIQLLEMDRSVDILRSFHIGFSGVRNKNPGLPNTK